MSNAHSHLTIGKQVAEIVAERDNLKAINAELLETLNKARQDINWMLNEQKFLNAFVLDYIDQAIAKATRKSGGVQRIS